MRPLRQAPKDQLQQGPTLRSLSGAESWGTADHPEGLKKSLGSAGVEEAQSAPEDPEGDGVEEQILAETGEPTEEGNRGRRPLPCLSQGATEYCLKEDS